MKTVTGAGKLKNLSERTYQGALRAPRRVYERIFAGYGTPFRWLSAEFGASVAGDTLIALGLAGTLFFAVPSAEARDKVALYLLLTLAPYSVIAPLLPRFFTRFPGSYRASLAGSSAGRAVIALLLAVGVNTFWLYPLAFTLLVLSRLHTVAKGSLVPVAVPGPEALVAANGLLARVGIVGGAVAIPIGAASVRWIGSWPALVVAAMFFLLAALCAGQVPSPSVPSRNLARRRGRHAVPRIARLPMIATAVVRFINGFLLALLAFVFKDIDAPLAEFGALLVAAGLGYGVASYVSPFLARRLREEPTVMAAAGHRSGRRLHHRPDLRVDGRRGSGRFGGPGLGHGQVRIRCVAPEDGHPGAARGGFHASGNNLSAVVGSGCAATGGLHRFQHGRLVIRRDGRPLRSGRDRVRVAGRGPQR